MTKQDLIADVAKKTGAASNEVRPIVEATIASIKESVEKRKTVYLRGFGTFSPKMRAAKIARNISKNTPVTVPAHEVAHFKPSKSFTIKK